jgi:sugar phosphate permease
MEKKFTISESCVNAIVNTLMETPTKIGMPIIELMKKDIKEITEEPKKESTITKIK